MKKRYSKKRAMRALKFYVLSWLILVIAVQEIWIAGHQYTPPVLIQIPPQKEQKAIESKIDYTVGVGTVRTVTAYTSRVEETDATPCIAADGTDICKRYAKGEKICAANFVPLGTRLTVEGVGTCTVADRMNNRYPERVDVYYGNDLANAIAFGVKSLQVHQ